MKPKVLFVDDDESFLAALYRTFKMHYDLDIALGGEPALRALEEHGPYAVVVADMAMPGMNGIEFLRKAQVTSPDTVRIMFTGHPGPVTLLEAINSGQVFRFIAKPSPHEEVLRAIDAGIRQYRLVVADRDLMESTLTRSIEAMTGILEVLDPDLYSAGQALAMRATQVARAMGAEDSWAITLAALYAPLWQLALTPSQRHAWAMGEPLSDGESQRLGMAIERAANLIQPIPRLDGVAQIIRFQGKGFDGSGIPGGPLQGSQIPIGSRILRALQDFDIIETTVKSKDVAMEELRMHSSRYDPDVLKAIESQFSTFDSPRS